MEDIDGEDEGGGGGINYGEDLSGLRVFFTGGRKLAQQKEKRDDFCDGE